ncbi:MAG: peptidylprolyl isomerase [Gammaproteobacteria bacterium]|nr:peptidylprolyl isomerase [Gammaproteobacteria bacterium]MDP2141929.1 peptidylprolyl isomerase [Gammaproteobacteria bacterium]MDP2347189.1 peptidylprolyl isomerase [Gammaproteobacteria bacterium]
MAVIRKQSSHKFSLYRHRRLVALVALVLSLVATGAVQANTIVRISTNYGYFSIELFDTVAPATVQNFLNYVNRGAYNGTYFHRLSKVDPEVLQGGGYRFQPFVGPIEVPGDPPVINEYSIPNTRGTIAMAKFAGDPNSATSQWFINVQDNSETLNESNNGGFTVFGQVLGDGMVNVDGINQLPAISLGNTHPQTPLRNFDLGVVKAQHFVTMNMEVMQRFTSAVSVFEYQSGVLQTSVDGGESLGAYSLALTLVPDRPNVVFKLDTDSMVDLEVKPEGISTFATSDNKLRIPYLEVNNNGNVGSFTNVILVLSDAVNWEFTLESYDQQ